MADQQTVTVITHSLPLRIQFLVLRVIFAVGIFPPLTLRTPSRYRRGVLHVWPILLPSRRRDGRLADHPGPDDQP